MSGTAGATLRRGNLPLELTSFVGRRREIGEVRRLLGQSRLVTLTGFGGVGKTRLAMRVASEVERGFAHGVWLVDLAPLRNPDLVPPAVVSALGMREVNNTSSLVALAEFLRDRQALIILDNCEHLLDACSALAVALLRNAPDLTIVATSRQPLAAPGEHVFAVPSLPAPPVECPAPPPEAWERYDALVLLIERARAIEPTFTVTRENAEALAQLTQRLDGIPLALELAAAKFRVLSPQQVLDRLDDRYGLLTTTARTVSPRQESLQALIDWSFELCSAEERMLWARLAVFARDFNIDAAEDICADDQLPRDHVVGALTGLADKSIVAPTGQGADMRHRLPEMLREYGRRRLVEAGSEGVLQRRYVDHYLRQTQRMTEEWFGPRQEKWMAWSQAEYANLRAALEFCLAEPELTTKGVELIPPLAAHWAVSGSLNEGRRFIDRVLAADPEPSPGRVDALWVAGRLALEQGDVDAAEAASEEAQHLARRYGDARGLGMSLGQLGVVRMLREDATAAERLFEEAVNAAAQHALPTAVALISWTWLAVNTGDQESARERLRRCLAICEAHGESRMRAEALWTQALLAWQEREVTTAKDAAREALRHMRATPSRNLIAQCLEVLAWVATAESDHERSARLLGAGGAIRDELGIGLPPALTESHERCEKLTRSALGSRAFSSAAQQGKRLGVEEAISSALGERPQAAPAPDGEITLTRREHEVADLVAQGMSNRDIAASLVISPRTAEAHVEHILTKLGFTSRTQIAAWVAERRTAS